MRPPSSLLSPVRPARDAKEKPAEPVGRSGRKLLETEALALAEGGGGKVLHKAMLVHLRQLEAVAFGPPPRPPAGVTHVRVVGTGAGDERAVPLPGLDVQLLSNEKSAARATTDATGFARLPLPGETKEGTLLVEVRAGNGEVVARNVVRPEERPSLFVELAAEGPLTPHAAKGRKLLERFARLEKRAGEIAADAGERMEARAAWIAKKGIGAASAKPPTAAEPRGKTPAAKPVVEIAPGGAEGRTEAPEKDASGRVIRPKKGGPKGDPTP